MDKARAGEQRALQYKVIRTRDFVAAANPDPGERTRERVLTENDQAKHINGILGRLPPSFAKTELAYHYHENRESIIQILSGNATEMIEGKPVPLEPGDIIYIPPNVKHTLVNNSSTQELKYVEFFSPIAPDSIQVK